MKVVHLICAARPNFMKVAPLYHALDATDWCHPVVVWGRQHTDDSMSGRFLVDFGIPNEGLIRFDATGGSHAEQTANAMMSYEKVIDNLKPDAIVVVGDVNTSMACALVGAKLGIPVVHLEAGLRSFDRSMPEEINRMVTDAVSDVLLTPSDDADANLFKEGISPMRTVQVGNIMIDAFEMLRPQIEAAPRRKGPYAVVTLHRPSNVDSPATLHALLDEIHRLSHVLLVVFPVHPRTLKAARSYINHDRFARVLWTDPLPYVEFMALVRHATIVITDSGGVQEETSYLGVPCATVRENTERPITVSLGTNVLISPADITSAARSALAGKWPKGGPIPLWDGKTADRIVPILKQLLH